MTASSLFAPQVGAALSLQEEFRNVEENPTAESLELLVESALQQANILRLAWSICTQDGSVWETGFYLQRVRTIELLAIIVSDILTRTREILARLRKDYPEWASTATVGEVDSSFQAVGELATGVRKTLELLKRPRPPLSEETIRRSRESIARVEGERIGEIIARLESGGPLVRDVASPQADRDFRNQPVRGTLI